jgi:hypothetical protein
MSSQNARRAKFWRNLTAFKSSQVFQAFKSWFPAMSGAVSTVNILAYLMVTLLLMDGTPRCRIDLRIPQRIPRSTPNLGVPII